MSFRPVYLRLSRKALGNAETVFRRLTYDIARRVILRTPVDTGRLRGNWQTSIDSPASGQLDMLDKSSPVNDAGVGPSSAADRALVTASALKLGQTAWIVNNLPYAPVIEYTGHSKQGTGMVRRSAAEARGMVRDIAKALKK